MDTIEAVGSKVESKVNSGYSNPASDRDTATGAYGAAAAAAAAAGAAVTAAKPPENSAAEGGEIAPSQGEEFASKSANAALGDGWAGFAAAAPTDEARTEGADKGTAPAFPRNVDDNSENRAQKGEYNRINNLLKEARGRGEGTGAGQRFSYSDQIDGIKYERYEDGRITATNTHEGLAIDKPEYDKLDFSVDKSGNLTKEVTDKEGTRTSTARSDGGYTEKNGQGETVKETSPDAKMRDYDRIASDWGRSVDKDGNKSPLSDEQKYTMTTALSGFDKDTLANLRKSGVKLETWDFQSNKLPGGERAGLTAGGYYAMNEGTLVINNNKFDGGVNTSATHVIRHEIGHAIDDKLLPPQAAQPDGQKGPSFLSMTDDKITGLYDKYKERSSNDDVGAYWTSVGKQDVREYFAEGVSGYTATGAEKERLMNKDPELHRYIEERMKETREPFTQ